jgi:flagellum-specific peptidoglycan hydrolase FlgJ
VIFSDPGEAFSTDDAASADIAQAAAARVSSYTPYAPQPRATGYEGQFIHALGMTARSTPGTDRIPPSVTIAQAILDSGWGRSQLAAKYRNYFGIKASGTQGTAGVVTMPTIEFYGGQAVWVNAAFRAYRSLADSVTDHHRFLQENSRYRAILQYGANNPAAFARGLQQAGFATDPQYADKLLNIMDRYQLYVYDVWYGSP